MRQLGEEKEDLSRRIPEYEKRMTTLSQELERVNGSLREKVNEVDKLNRQLREGEQRSSSEIQSRVT